MSLLNPSFRSTLRPALSPSLGRAGSKVATASTNTGDAILRADGISAIKRSDGTSDIVRH